jgi:hypothetical protein
MIRAPLLQEPAAVATFFDPIRDSMYLTWVQLQAFLPKLLAAALILLGGWLFARLFRRIVIKLLRMAQVEQASERAGLDDFLLRGGVRFTTVTLVGQIAYWGVFLVVALAVFNLLGLPVSTSLIEEVVRYVPSVMVALVIIVFGSLLARFVSGAVRTYLDNIGVAGARAIGFMTQGALLIFVAVLALEQLRIGGQVLVSAFQLAFGGLCLAMALAFGLGGREWAAGILERTWKAR